MKQLNETCTKLISGTLASSVLLASCTTSSDIETILVDSNTILDEDILQTKGIPLSLLVDDETQVQVKIMAPLVNEIINDPEIAAEFTKDPSAFLTKRGCHLLINPDEHVMKILLALGDKEVNEALKNGDIDTFVSLCLEKKLLNEDQQIKLNVVFNGEEEQRLFEAIAGALHVTPDGAVTKGVAFWLAVSVVVVIAIVITYTVGVDDQDRPYEPDYAFLHSTSQDCSVLDLWALKAEGKRSYQVVDEYKNKLVEKLMVTLKHNKPEIFTTFEEKQICEFLKRNMLV